MCVCACVCVFTHVIFTASLPAISSSSAWRVPEPAGERNWVWPRVEVFCSQCCRVLLISKACAWEYSQTQKEWGRYHATLSLFLKKKWVWEKEEGQERERDINLLFHLFMHLLVDSCMCPDWGSNLQPWRTRPNQLSYLARAMPLFSWSPEGLGLSSSASWSAGEFSLGFS